MRNTSTLLLFGLAIFLAGPLQAQSSCPGLSITSVLWAPFDTNVVVVHVTNTSQDIFSYPSFVLMNGADTVATEGVTFFGIGGISVHRLALLPTAPSAPDFQGTLHLYTNFGQELACTIVLPVSLCPATCITFEANLWNTVNEDVSGQFAFVIADASDTNVGDGLFEIGPGATTASVPVCLAPGAHTMRVSAPFSSVTTLRFGVSHSGGGISEQESFVPGVQGTELPFTIFERCVEAANGLEDVGPLDHVVLSVQGRTITIRSVLAEALGAVRVLDMQGRTLREEQISANEVNLALEGYAAGCYLIVIGEDRHAAQRFLLH